MNVSLQMEVCKPSPYLAYTLLRFVHPTTTPTPPTTTVWSVAEQVFLAALDIHNESTANVGTPLYWSCSLLLQHNHLHSRRYPVVLLYAITGNAGCTMLLLVAGALRTVPLMLTSLLVVVVLPLLFVAPDAAKEVPIDRERARVTACC